MPDYSVYKPEPGGKDYPAKISSFIDRVGADIEDAIILSEMTQAISEAVSNRPTTQTMSTAINNAVDSLGDVVTASEMSLALAEKQDKLFSGTNIKTINGQSILGGGNIVIEGGTGGGDMYKSTYDADGDGKVDAAEVADAAPWSGITNKPSTFPPATHNHDSSYAPALTADDNYMTDTEKTKLGGIADGANNYTHPSSHSPSIISQDSNNRFVSDTERAAWNGKAALNTAQTFTKTQTPARSAVTPSAPIDWDASTVQVLEVTLTATRLFNAPTNLVAGTSYGIRIIGAYVPTWNTVFKNISSYTSATTATKADFLTFYCSDGTNLELVGVMYNCNGGA